MISVRLVFQSKKYLNSHCLEIVTVVHYGRKMLHSRRLPVITDIIIVISKIIMIIHSATDDWNKKCHDSGIASLSGARSKLFIILSGLPFA